MDCRWRRRFAVCFKPRSGLLANENWGLTGDTAIRKNEIYLPGDAIFPVFIFQLVPQHFQGSNLNTYAEKKRFKKTYWGSWLGEKLVFESILWLKMMWNQNLFKPKGKAKALLGRICDFPCLMKRQKTNEGSCWYFWYFGFPSWLRAQWPYFWFTTGLQRQFPSQRKGRGKLAKTNSGKLDGAPPWFRVIKQERFQKAKKKQLWIALGRKRALYGHVYAMQTAGTVSRGIIFSHFFILNFIDSQIGVSPHNLQIGPKFAQAFTEKQLRKGEGAIFIFQSGNHLKFNLHLIEKSNCCLVSRIKLKREAGIWFKGLCLSFIKQKRWFDCWQMGIPNGLSALLHRTKNENNGALRFGHPKNVWH